MAQKADLEKNPLELAENNNVVGFTHVDGVAFIFAKTSLEGEPVRAQLDEIYADTGMEFWTARHSSTVDLDSAEAPDSDDYDMLFLYEEAA